MAGSGTPLVVELNYAGQLAQLLQRAMHHPGLAYLDVWQPCPTSNDGAAKERWAGKDVAGGQPRLSDVAQSDHNRRRQRLYPVVEPDGHLIGVVTDNDLQNLLQELQTDGNGRQLAELIKPNPVVAYPDEPLRIVVYRMAETGFTRLPVVSPPAPGRLVGIISLSGLLKARVHHLEEERYRERILQMRLLGPLRSRRLHRIA